MIYRKKILLALLELFGGELSATDFQKLLFIFTDQQEERQFDFVPYKFGCFSFQAMADKNKLIKEGYLESQKNWEIKIGNTNFIDTLNITDRNLLLRLKNKFGNAKTKDLIRYVYLNYPYFAINSEIVQKYISTDELQIIENFKPQDQQIALFTIGYEGKSLEQYLNLLIQKNVKIICDVRKNPVSRKYGFAKKTLQNACEAVNIKYIHLPELGIVSEKRKSLKNQKDYDILLDDYEKNIIPYQKTAIKLIYDLLNNYNRVALTCYEIVPEKCHRIKVANTVLLLDNSIPLKHI